MSYDAIIIGAGHNGLVAAVRLAQQRKKVLVIEKRATSGGLAGAYDLENGFVSPGVLHDASCVPKWLLKKLKLDSSHIQWEDKRPALSILSPNGEAITLQEDDAVTASSLSSISEHDAEAYVRYRKFIHSITPFLRDLLYKPQPDLLNLDYREIWRLAQAGLGLKRLGKRTMNEFLKVGPMSVADFLGDYFETDFLKAGLALPAVIGSFTGPWSSYTTLNLLLYEATSGTHVTSGPDSYAFALAKRAEELGVQIVTGEEVQAIVFDKSGTVSGVQLEGGKEEQAKVVVASNSPKSTFLDLIPSNRSDHSLVSQFEHLRTRGTTAKVTLVIDNPVEWIGDNPQSQRARIVSGIDDLERAFDSLKYGEFSKSPALDVFISGNPDHAPGNHRVVSVLVNFAPMELREGWTDKTRKELLQNVIDVFLPTTSLDAKNIVSTEVLTPEDLAAHFGIPGGNIHHIEHAVDQLIGRPVPRCSGHHTPIKNLFLCGSGTHPGGGITGVPGYFGSQAVVSHM